MTLTKKRSAAFGYEVGIDFVDPDAVWSGFIYYEDNIVSDSFKNSPDKVWR